MKVMMRLSFVCCLVLTFGVRVANSVPLNADPSALQKGYSPIQAVEGDSQLYGGVSYAVYNKADYTGFPLPQFANDNQFVYAYQIEISSFATTDMSSFAIDIPAGTQTYNIGYDPSKAVLGGIWPNQQAVVGNSAQWQFLPDTLGPGTHSIVLLFTSDFGPGQSNAELTVDSITGSISASVAAPVPEPLTIVLLGMGAAAILGKRSRRKPIING